jgi:hypothetical protein
MTRNLCRFLLLLIMITSLMGCDDGQPASIQPSDSSKSVYEENMADRDGISADEAVKDSSENIIEITGTVVYKEIEGGFYAIDADDGSKYDPVNLPESFKKDGLKVKVTAENTDMMSIHMYGSVIKIINQ